MQKQKPENKIVHTTAKGQLCAEDEQYGKENKCSRVQSTVTKHHEGNIHSGQWGEHAE